MRSTFIWFIESAASIKTVAHIQMNPSDLLVSQVSESRNKKPEEQLFNH